MLLTPRVAAVSWLLGLIGSIHAVDSSGGDWRAALQRAVGLHQQGDLVGAAPFYEHCLREQPALNDQWPVLTNAALCLQEAGRAAEAVPQFRRVLTLNPTSSDAYFNLGNALVDLGERAEAHAAFEQCIGLNPGDAEAHYNYGCSQLAGALDQDKGATEGQTVLEGDASRAGVSIAVESAVESLRTSINLAPADAKAHVALGDGLAEQRRWGESAHSYRRAASLRPEHAGTHAGLGNALEELGQLEDAESCWRRAIELHAGATDASGVYNNLGSMLRRMGRMGEAKAALTAAVTLVPTSAEAYIALGKAWAGKPSESTDYLKHLRDTYGTAIKLQPQNANAYNAIAEGMAMVGLQGGCDEFGGEGALQMYEHALAIDPSSTCAATHVAFGRRAPRAAAGVDSGSLGDHQGPESLDVAVGGAPAASISELSAAEPNSLADAAAARERWRRNGAVSFPALLSTQATKALLERVRAAQHGEHTRDYTQVTRDKTNRVHKALPVSEAEEALVEVARKLGPFLCEVLGADQVALLESGFMVTSPGAATQQFHRDVAPDVVSRSSLTASIQISLVDTAANQGCLEVVPGSQEYDAAFTDEQRLAALPKVRVAVPAGTVTVYALHTMHRGTANTHASADRPFFFFTLMGEGLAPPGLAYTVQPDDIGVWAVGEGRLLHTVTDTQA